MPSEYRMADGHALTDEILEEEARLYERGERPDNWKAADEEFDRAFDSGEDLSEFVDWDSAKAVPPSII